MLANYYPQFICELRREFHIWRSYRLNAFSSLIMWGIIFPILLVTVQNVARDAGVEFGPRQQASSIIGFLVWNLCVGVLVTIPYMVEEEARTGTLENVMVSSFVSFTALFFFRIVARTIRSLLETILLAVMLVFVFRIDISLSPTALLIIFLTLAGVWGVGYALAGLTIVYKAVGSITSMVGNLAFLISGALVPINGLGMIFTILKYVFPMTWGIDLLRSVLLGNENLVTLIRNGELPGLLFQTIALITIGLIIFNKNLGRVKERGELSSY